MFDFRILGPLEVLDDNVSVPLGGRKQRATLAILLLHANRVVSVDRLADDLYAGAPPVTAVTQVQRQVSELRKALGVESAIETRPPGYLIHVSPDCFDLARFERLTSEADSAHARGDSQTAASLLGNALALWRGLPLADLAYEPFAQVAIERLEEIRLAAVEQRIEAELALGRHGDLIGELTELLAEHPLRESLGAHLMLALYRSGRQAESLDVYSRMRVALTEQFGIEPTRVLRDLERAVLIQDRTLDLGQEGGERTGFGDQSDHAILVLPPHENRLDALLAIAEPLARSRSRELIIAHLVADEDEVPGALVAVNARRAALGSSRVAVFTTRSPAEDVARLVAAHSVDLVLLGGPNEFEQRLPDDVVAVLERSTSDVGLLAGVTPDLRGGDGVFVPFGGGEHDWAALELAGWLATATSSPLRLIGTKADPRRGRRDASRLLADASLAVQRFTGVETEVVLAEPSEDGLLRAVESATVVVVGISDQWRRHGVGASRLALARGARPPTLLVHRGLRPGGLAPRQSRTRFAWTIDVASR